MDIDVLVENQKAAVSWGFLSSAQKSHYSKAYGVGLFIFLFTVLLLGIYIFVVAPGQ